jgi:hypothetical protein
VAPHIHPDSERRDLRGSTKFKVEIGQDLPGKLLHAHREIWETVMLGVYEPHGISEIVNHSLSRDREARKLMTSGFIEGGAPSRHIEFEGYVADFASDVVMQVVGNALARPFYT